MKYVIYYNRKAANDITYKHYYISDGTYCMDKKFARKFEDELNARKFSETISHHYFIVEPLSELQDYV